MERTPAQLPSRSCQLLDRDPLAAGITFVLILLERPPT
jgi:hypothetical protein